MEFLRRRLDCLYAPHMEPEADRPNPYQPPKAGRAELAWKDEPLTFAQTPQERHAGPEGLGGWLIVVAIKLVMTVLTGCGMLMTILRVFTDGSWALITTPGTDAYHPLFGPLIVFEAAVNSVLVGASLGLLVMFFRKAPGFPRWMIFMLIFGPVLTLIDIYWASRIPSVGNATDGDIRGLAQMIASACIWVPYLLVSKRVRNTFTARRTSRRRIEPTLEATAAGNATA